METNGSDVEEVVWRAMCDLHHGIGLVATRDRMMPCGDDSRPGMTQILGLFRGKCQSIVFDISPAHLPPPAKDIAAHACIAWNFSHMPIVHSRFRACALVYECSSRLRASLLNLHVCDNCWVDLGVNSVDDVLDAASVSMPSIADSFLVTLTDYSFVNKVQNVRPQSSWNPIKFTSLQHRVVAGGNRQGNAGAPRR